MAAKDKSKSMEKYLDSTNGEKAAMERVDSAKNCDRYFLESR
jgi:hypothetical protein